MRRLLGLLGLAFVLVVAAPTGVALAKTTADFSYKSDGSAAAPGAVAGTGEDGTYQDFPFTIAADDQDGAVSVEVHWSNPADDWDLYVYKKNSTGGLDQVGNSAGAPPSDTESTVIQQQGTSPVEPGDYVVRVQNYAATSTDFSGVVKFAPFAIPNKRPVAKLKAPKTGLVGKKLKLDASGSHDPDGSIKNYAFDLDGDGSIETDNGTNPVLKHAFSAGVHHIEVRVTDDKGRRAYASRTIRVKAPQRTKRRGNR